MIKKNLEDNLEKKTEKNLEKSLNKKIEKDLDKKLNKKMDKKAEIKIKTKLRMNYILMALFIFASAALMLFINYFQKVLNVSRTASGITIFVVISIIFLLYGLIAIIEYPLYMSLVASNFPQVLKRVCPLKEV